MQTTAAAAGARLLVGIEGCEQRREIFDGVGQRDLDPVNECTALEAKPLEPILLAGWTWALDDKPDRAGHRTLR